MKVFKKIKRIVAPSRACNVSIDRLTRLCWETILRHRVPFMEYAEFNRLFVQLFLSSCPLCREYSTWAFENCKLCEGYYCDQCIPCSNVICIKCKPSLNPARWKFLKERDSNEKKQ